MEEQNKMSKLKKHSRKKTINHFLKEAQYYNNAGQFKKAIAKVNIAYSIWEGYKNGESAKADKMLNKIDFARDIIVNNYIAVKEQKIRAMFFS